MTEYPKVIHVGVMSLVVNSKEEEAQYLTARVEAGLAEPPAVDDVSPEPQTYVPDAPVPMVEEPKKKAGKKK